VIFIVAPLIPSYTSNIPGAQVATGGAGTAPAQRRRGLTLGAPVC
jgi:hypothetical protein